MAVKSSDPIDILLEMGIDLDNLSEEEDYLSALKEAVATIEFQTKGSGDERSAILSKEVVKVRKARKEADPTFKARKTTIKPDAFFKKQKALFGTTKVKSSAIVPVPKKEDEVQPGGDILKDILRGVNSILGTLQNQNKFTKKQSEKDRKSAERKKRGAQEDKLEKGALSKFLGGAKKLLKPVTNFFEEIFKFIVNILIGRLLVKLINWMGDEKNSKKMKAIQDFFKVTWPAFLAVFLAFSLGLGGFITSIIGLVGGFIPKILGLIPKMLKGLGALAMGNPITTAIVAGSALAAIGAITSMNQNEGEREEQNKKNDAGTVTPAETRETGEMPKGPQLMEEMNRQRGMGAMFNSGGIVPGSGPDKDTVPAMLSPGEFVMSRGAVDKYGANTMESMNAMGGGTNRPMVKDGMTYAQGGGFAGSKNRPEKSSKKQDMGDRKKESSGNFLTNMFGGGSKKDTKVSSSSGGGFNESSLRKAMDKAGYTDPTERAMFLAQMAHESGNFKYDEEIWGPTPAQRGYEGRGDLGNTQPGDGKKYLGRGYIQLTGRANYTYYGKKLGVDLAGNPELAKRPDIAADIAVAYWKERVNREAARKGDVKTVTKNINGGYNGLQDRIDKFKKYSGDSNYSAPGGGLKPPSSSGGSGGSSGSGIKYKKPSSSTSNLKVNTGPSLMDLYNEQEKSSGRSGTMGNRSDATPNPAATNVAPSNDLPSIDANAMISQEKIKVLGITVV